MWPTTNKSYVYDPETCIPRTNPLPMTVDRELMAAVKSVYPTPGNTYIPSFEVDQSLVRAFSRDPAKFTVNRYVKMTPKEVYDLVQPDFIVDDTSHGD